MSDYDKCWDEFWRPIICDSTGSVDLEQVKKELFDFWQAMDRVPKVYDYVTGGRITKILTDADAVCSVVDDHYASMADHTRRCLVRDDSGHWFTCPETRRGSALQWFVDAERGRGGDQPPWLQSVDLPNLTFVDPQDL